MKVQEVASLDEKSVQAVAKGEVPDLRTKPRRGARRRRTMGNVEIKVDPRVWEVAMASRPRAACVQVLGQGEVIVWNHPHQKERLGGAVLPRSVVG